MNSTIKFSIITVIATILLMAAYGIIKALLGNYMVYNPFGAIFMIAAFVILVFLGIKLSKNIWLMSIVALGLLTMNSCNYAKSNQQVLVSDDCGMSWKKINPGESVPRGTMNYCYMKVVVPNYPMQGDATFVTNLKDKVRANIHIDYDYSITNALLFVKQAKSLGRANANPDDPDAINEKGFEMAENMVIDKRIREVAKAIFIQEDIVDMDQTEVEALIHRKTNKILAELGVELNFITLTLDLDDQTRQAIDISTAMKIYESRGIQELGKEVMKERAGATKVTVNTKTVNTATPVE
jgi:hypothetical protein